MTKPKNPEPNPIEEAIGDRAKKPEELKTGYTAETFPQNPSKIPDEPSPSEMLTLEELNRQTEERLQEEPIQMGMASHTVPKASIIPVSKPDLLPQVVETSSPESPVETIKSENTKPPQITDTPSVEDIELTNLKKYILEDGINEAAVAFHIVTLCSQPLVTTSTTTWDFKDRAKIPEMVLALLHKSGYIEGLWPSLKIIMGSNVGNAAWSSGVAMTIAFFDTIRMLPVLEELRRCSETEQK